MNCSPRKSSSARAVANSVLICSVTVFSCASASAIGSAMVVEVAADRVDAGDGHLQIPVEHPLHDHHGVVALLHRLPVEVRGELRKVVRVEPNRDRDVLLAGGELVSTCARRRPTYRLGLSVADLRPGHSERLVTT